MIEIEGTPYQITIEGKKYILLKRKKPGEEYQEFVGQYPSLPWALKGCRKALQRDLLQTGTFTLLTALEALKCLDERFEAILHGLKV